MGKFNLSEAAKDILLGEDSKTTFDANIKQKMGMRGGEKAPHGEVGADKLPTSTVAGQQDVGEIGQSPEEENEALPDYLKGTPTATPPGATPPVGSEKDGVGIKKISGPQDSMGRKELTRTTQSPATDYSAIRDRIMGKLAPQTMQANPGATFQSYGEEAEYDDESLSEEDKMMKHKMETKKMVHDKMKDKMKEDIDALLSGENLSEEFKSKAVTIFEAAVVAKATTVVEEIENELIEQFELAVEQVKEDLTTKVDEYLNYFVEEWYQDNQIAIEKGLKAEIVEDFITELRDVFVKHYIDIPTDKVDIVEELTNKVEELEESLNEQIQYSIEMKKELKEHKKMEAIHAVCEGLTQTQVEKMKALAEGVEFTTDEEFAVKLSTLVESYFDVAPVSNGSSTLNEGVEVEEETKQIVSEDPTINIFAKAITQSVKG
jgi:hypothetical protein